MFWDSAVAHIGILGLAALALIIAAYNDARHYRIPNITSAVLLALFPLFVLETPGDMEWPHHLAAFVGVLMIGYVIFLKKLAGAGDIKLMAAVSLWAGPASIGAFLLVTAIAGGLLGLMLAGITWSRNRSLPPDQVVPLRKIPIPYGVAIAIGGLVVLMQLARPLLFQA